MTKINKDKTEVSDEIVIFPYTCLEPLMSLELLNLPELHIKYTILMKYRKL